MSATPRQEETREREREGHRERARGKEGGAGGEREERETVDRETILTVEGEVNVHRDPELAQASRKSRRKPSPESREFSAPLSLSLTLSFARSLARSLVPSISLSFSLVRDLPLSLSPVPSLLSRARSSRLFHLSFFPSFSRAYPPWCCRSVTRSVGQFVRQVPVLVPVASAKDLTWTNERVCACERAIPRSSCAPAVHDGFLCVLSLSPSRSFSLARLSLSLSPYPAHTRRTQCCQKSGSSAPELHAAAIAVTVWFSLAAR